MRKIVVFSLLFSFCIFGAFASDMPIWCSSPYSYLNKKQYIAASGSGRNLDQATQNAYEQLGAYFEINVNAQMYSAVVDNGSASAQSFKQNVSTDSSVSGIVGVKRYATYNDGGTYYALLAIDKNEVFTYYTTAIAECEEEIEACLVEIEKNRGTIYLFPAAYQLSRIEKEYSDCYTIYTKIAPVVLIERKYTSGYLVSIINDSFSSYSLSLEVEGDDDGKIESGLRRELSKLGFVLSRNANYKVEANVETEDTKMPSYYMVNMRLNVKVKDINGKSLASFAYKAKGTSPLSTSDAERRAMNKIENSIVDEFPNDFIERFTN